MDSESSTTKNSLEVILSPALLPFYDVSGKTVVMIDILRASSSICVAFQHGVRNILPVATPEEARLFRDFDFIIAAERNAVKVDGFDLGNSPFEYENALLRDKSIAFTTTNGTRAIKQARELGAASILIGSFLNISALCTHVRKTQQSVVLLCAGWKNKVNLEDTLFAGAVADRLSDQFDLACDAAKVAQKLYQQSASHLTEEIQQSSHARRFTLLHGNTDDVTYCLQHDTINLVPYMKGEYLICDQAPSASHG